MDSDQDTVLSSPRPRLLAIEDDRDAAGLIADVLDDHFGGPCVTIAVKIADAVALRLENFDLVLSDFNLPDGNGLDAIRRIFERRPDMPVIMVTGEAGITTALQAVRLGAYDYVVKSTELLTVLPMAVEKNLERWRMQQENLRLHEELKASLEDARYAQEQLSTLVGQLEEMALTDALTGLSNRRHINEVLPRLFAEASRYGSNLSCVMIDLDGFKEVNDTHGHQRGDEMLEIAGGIIAANRRESDIAGRYGGDEFVILMPQTSQETAMNMVRRIVEQFERAIDTQFEFKPNVTMSVGISSQRTSVVTSGEKLLMRSDDMLYVAKKSGKAKIVLDGGPSAKARGYGPDGRPVAGIRQRRETAA